MDCTALVQNNFPSGRFFITLTQGYEPYEDEHFDPDHGTGILDRLKAMVFPNLGGGR
jgi:hypothetical protein